jgi:hypothetical protein
MNKGEAAALIRVKVSKPPMSITQTHIRLMVRGKAKVPTKSSFGKR